MRLKGTRPSRRVFLKQIAGVSAGVLGCNGANQLFGGLGGNTVLVRKDISALPPKDPILTALKKGIEVMRQRPSTDRTSWVAQANIHNSACTHDNWFFLPWHRAYLYYFEQICREASENPEFALPYWNWTKNPKLTSDFWGSGNPLNDDTREIGPNDLALNSTVGQEFIGQQTIADILSVADFETFASGAAYKQREHAATGRLEGAPH